MVELTAGEGRYQLRIRALETGGNGLVVFLTGGERPHLGGVALACVPSADNAGLSHCDTWELTLPGHKDKELAARLARKLCLALREPVSVNVGIHIDKAGPEEIALLCEQAEEITDRFIREYLEVI